MRKQQTSNRILRMRDLPSKVGYEPTTIYGLITQGKFPPPFKLRDGGRAAGWYESTIDEWLNQDQTTATSEGDSHE